MNNETNTVYDVDVHFNDDDTLKVRLSVDFSRLTNASNPDVRHCLNAIKTMSESIIREADRLLEGTEDHD